VEKVNNKNRKIKKEAVSKVIEAASFFIFCFQVSLSTG
jgi:hypothetical protein